MGPTDDPRATARLRETLTDLVTVATRAPSPLNTQPWRFRWRDDGIDLLADRSRQLMVTDPEGRQLSIACGAALFNLRLAARKAGIEPVTAILPDPGDPDLVARVAPGRLQAPEPEDEELLAAVPYRYTHRGEYTEAPVPPDALLAMQQAAAHEGATLHIVSDPEVRSVLAGVVARADEAQRADPRYAAEIAAWTPPPGDPRRDGVPATAYPRQVIGEAGAFHARDHALGRDQGVRVREPGRIRPELAVLTTPDDRPRDWVRAGLALQRVLLTGTRRWIFASFFGQVMELAQLRPAVREHLGLPDYPQVVLRMGKATATVSTPRRPVEELLVE